MLVAWIVAGGVRNGIRGDKTSQCIDVAVGVVALYKAVFKPYHAIKAKKLLKLRLDLLFV